MTMSRKMLQTLAASLVAASIGTAALTVPAAAGGSISFTYVPTNTQDAQALRAGLGLYALYKGIQNGSITQLGMNNMAGLLQNGSGNLGIIHQEGDGHTGTLQQNGNNNACGIFQFGEGTTSNLTQNGDNGACASISYGW
jgi:hypothetical protein